MSPVWTLTLTPDIPYTQLSRLCGSFKMRMPAKLNVFLLISGSLACFSSPMADQTITVLARVNGTDITTEQIEQLPGGEATFDFASLEDDRKTQIIIALINRQLVIEQAQKEGFDQSERMINAVKDMTETFVTQQYLMKVAAGTDLSEDTLLAYYNDHYSDQPEQYSIAHIQLASQGEAYKVLESLNKGADFSELARTESKDQVSAEKGGELGWLTAEDMLPSFYKTVSELNPGAISAKPTKTQFGWHIVRLDGKRRAEPRSFSALKQQIQQQLIKEEIATYLDKLRTQASVEIR